VGLCASHAECGHTPLHHSTPVPLPSIVHLRVLAVDCAPAVASEGGPYEDGIGEGDFITVTFNKPTNMIELDTDARIRDLFNFSANIGSQLSA
jgi:hypothetical protein